MKIIEQSVELVDNFNPADIYNKIELCGRVCYQSEPKGQPEKFIRMLIKKGHESVLEHVSLTFHIVTNRAIQNELVRHRLCAFSVESTRYVNYKELTTIFQTAKIPKDLRYIFLTALDAVACAYRKLIDSNITPEFARNLLPLCTKSEMYMTANIREWRHILKLRTDKAAHPQMRQLAGMILQIFKDKLSVFVEDIK